jgi:hypothetical protein
MLPAAQKPLHQSMGRAIQSFGPLCLPPSKHLLIYDCDTLHLPKPPEFLTDC